MRLKVRTQFLLCTMLLLSFSTKHFAQISITGSGFSVTENFSTLASSGTSSTVPAGWAFLETGTNANTIYTAGTGSSNTGDTYSFGLANDPERAFGGLQSGSLTPTIGASFINNSGGTITGFSIAYTGETWRVGATGRADGIQFQYSINATALNNGTWISVPALDYFNIPFATAPQSGSMLHSAFITSALSGLNIPNGTTFWIRWSSVDVTGSDDGLAIDDFTLNNVVIPPANDLCVNATPISCNQTLSNQTNVGAANEEHPVCNTQGILDVGQVDVWYTFTGTGGNVTLSTCSNFDTEIGVFSGSCAGLVCVAGSDTDNATDPSCNEVDEILTFSTTAGTTYYIMVQGDNNDPTGVFSLTLTCVAPPPPCEIIGYSFSNISGCNDNGTPSDPADDYFTVNVEVLYSNSTNGDSLILEGGDLVFRQSMIALVGTNVTSTFSTVRFRADGQPVDFTGVIGTFSTPHCSLPGTGPAVNSCSNAPTAPVNDLCANALPLACDGSVSGTTINATYDDPMLYPACGVVQTTNGVWYTITGNGNPITLSTCGAANFDTKISVYTGSCAAASCVGGNDDACGGAQSEFTFNSVNGQVYYVMVHGFGGAEGNFTLSATCNTPPVTLNCPVTVTYTACQTQAFINQAFANWVGAAVASGGCNGVLTNNNTGAPSACGGSTTVTWTYTSTCAPFTTTCTSTFTVDPAPPPTLNCPVSVTYNSCLSQATIDQAFANWLNAPVSGGGCGGTITNNNVGGAPSVCTGGSKTVTWTFTPTCGQPITCSSTFTVAAPPPVVLSCPTNTTLAACQTQAAVNTAFANWLATATASGGCNGVLTNNNVGAPSACGGSTTVTFTYTSSCAPATTTCQATFTVAVPSPIVLTCPTPTTVSACLTQAQLNTAYTNWLASATASGGCNATITNNAPAAPLICNPNAQTITVTFSATNSCTGVTTTCTSTFTVPAYPDFTVPANTASTVACPSQIVQPTPPTVLDACGKALTPTGPVIVNNPNPITCEGTRTFTWTYTDCSGHVKTWSHVTTVERQPFGVPANGGATVACPDQTDVQPVPPVVTSNCGEILTPVITSTAKPGCEGNRNWNFTYTDCEGNTATWVFIYIVEYQDFAVPASEVLTVNCPINAVQPTPPVVMDNCGKLLTPMGPVITQTNNASGCEGTRKYEWKYTDCEGNTHTWSRTYNFEYDGDFFVYPDGETPVGCLSYAEFPPIPPTVYGTCGEEATVTGPFITETIAPDGCSGTRKFTFIYSDCGGHSHPWSFTYYAQDNDPPVGNCPGGSLTNNVDETDLDCIEEVPCPDDYDFSDKIEELLAAGNFYDYCSGTNLVVELDSWSALWQCSDTDGDGIYTFGRTFYFSIADQCGNVYPDLCAVTYSGKCLPLTTYTQGEWGNEGDEPGNSLPGAPTDLQVITTLLGQGPLVIGGTHRSLTLTNAQCLMNLVPGVGNPDYLANCQQTNCVGCNPAGPIGMKNVLASNTISLILNMRYNIEYNGLTMNAIRSQSLGCLTIDPNIVYCDENSNCKLRVFESDGTEHVFPYTLGGLLDLSNLFLDAGWNFTVGQKYTYGAALNSALNTVNGYWHDGVTPTACDQGAGVTNPIVVDNQKLPTVPSKVKTVEFTMAPNPAGNEVVFKLAEMPESQPVRFELYNQLGQLVLSQDFGVVSGVNERIDLSAIRSGLYIVSVKAGTERYEQKLVIGKD